MRPTTTFFIFTVFAILSPVMAAPIEITAYASRHCSGPDVGEIVTNWDGHGNLDELQDINTPGGRCVRFDHALPEHCTFEVKDLNSALHSVKGPITTAKKFTFPLSVTSMRVKCSL